MSTIPEHIAFLRQLRQDVKKFPNSPSAQQLYQSQAYLLVEAHLEEIAALVEPTCEWIEVEEGSDLWNTCKEGDEFQVHEGLELWPHCHWCGGKIVARTAK